MSESKPNKAKNQGIDALNQQFSHYEQVQKTQAYHLAEKPGLDVK